MTDPTKNVPHPIDTSDVTLPEERITKIGFTIEKK